MAVDELPPTQDRAQSEAPGEPPKKDGRINPIMAAAVVGGTVAAAAGAYWGTRALARRNREEGAPINSVMATAITACDLAHRKDPAEPAVETEPGAPAEPHF